jgi:hypothetical protein
MDYDKLKALLVKDKVSLNEDYYQLQGKISDNLHKVLNFEYKENSWWLPRVLGMSKAQDQAVYAQLKAQIAKGNWEAALYHTKTLEEIVMAPLRLKDQKDEYDHRMAMRELERLEKQLQIQKLAKELDEESPEAQTKKLDVEKLKIEINMKLLELEKEKFEFETERRKNEKSNRRAERWEED